MTEQIEEVKALLGEYPKTKQLLVDWMTGKIQQLQKMSVPEGEQVEMPPIRPEDIEMMLCGQIAFSPRFLYEFFDEQKVYLSVRYSIQNFCSRINEEDTPPCYPTRLEAEKDGFLRCFEITEKQL